MKNKPIPEHIRKRIEELNAQVQARKPYLENRLAEIARFRKQLHERLAQDGFPVPQKDKPE